MLPSFVPGSLVRAALAALLIAAVHAPVSLGAATFIRFLGTPAPGSAVLGNSTSANYPAADGWFEFESVQYGIARAVSLGGGGGGGFSSSSPQVSEVVFTLPFGRSSTVLLGSVARGLQYTEVEIVFTRQTSKQETVLKMEFAQAIPTSVSLSSGGDLPYASISFAFVAQRLTWFEIPDGGGPATSTVTAYDFARQTADYPLP